MWPGNKFQCLAGFKKNKSNTKPLQEIIPNDVFEWHRGA